MGADLDTKKRAAASTAAAVDLDVTYWFHAEKLKCNFQSGSKINKAVTNSLSTNLTF